MYVCKYKSAERSSAKCTPVVRMWGEQEGKNTRARLSVEWEGCGSFGNRVCGITWCIKKIPEFTLKIKNPTTTNEDFYLFVNFYIHWLSVRQVDHQSLNCSAEIVGINFLELTATVAVFFQFTGISSKITSFSRFGFSFFSVHGFINRTIAVFIRSVRLSQSQVVSKITVFWFIILGWLATTTSSIHR